MTVTVGNPRKFPAIMNLTSAAENNYTAIRNPHN